MVEAVARVDRLVKEILASSGQHSRLLKCSICAKFCSKVNIKRHLLTHMDIPYKCGQCSVYFHLKSELDYHMEERHSNKEYVCDDCGGVYKAQKALKEHILIKHSQNRLAYCCDVCGKQFNRLRHYMDHMNVHKDVSPWVCNDCGRSYKNRSAFSRHVSECGRDTAAQCDHCSKLYKTRRLLHQHIKSEHSGDQYLCECGNAFKNRSARMRHRKMCLVYQEGDTFNNDSKDDNTYLDPSTGVLIDETNKNPDETSSTEATITSTSLGSALSGNVAILFETAPSYASVCSNTEVKELIVVSDVENVDNQVAPGEILEVRVIPKAEVSRTSNYENNDEG